MARKTAADFDPELLVLFNAYVHGAMDRRGFLDQVVSRLLGLEMKLAQYRRGKAFCDEVVRHSGVRALNAVWRGPEALPSSAELDEPGAWIERVGAGRRRFALLR